MFVILFYDFGERRVAKALKICRKYLTWVQNSVFEGEITQANYKKLTHELSMKMDKDEDSLIIYTFANMKYSTREVIGVEKNPQSIFL
ncbi:CRISPR-associated endonuclease Cas2 [Lutispora saccharofermentans]|uniref:CRISPR-associated endoribonuclease Cas2 n=1 Tax=Lutispora saccharofermentans TaxID=3024236 RepID=A0ABT1NG97_9FIRM|nr:CRISPR-associated endonuclease Cas2 [Lutispora saccharofermentans]MCQ1529173.1 CRISPR-associated endonuclease Cas2 [Lutispora saccharofermentans]